MLDTIDLLTDKIINEVLKQPNKMIRSDEPLISSGLIDSFSLVDLAMMVEECFGVRIDDYELNANTFDTIEELAVLIQERS